MSKFNDNIRKIALTEETNAKIKPPVFKDKSTLGSRRGVSVGEKAIVCDTRYTTRDNSYDIGNLLAGTAGPILNDHCDHIDKLTGLTDFDTAQNTDNYGGAVTLVIHFNGLF